MIRRTFIAVLLAALWAPIATAGEGVHDALRKNVQLQAETLLLDAYPTARAAYSLRKLRDTYDGPALTVRRGSDNATTTVGFDGDGTLDTSALETWLSGADGFVTRWHSQVAGEPDLVQADPARQPRIAGAGTATTDSGGRVAIKFDSDRDTYLTTESSFSSWVPVRDAMTMFTVDDEARHDSGDRYGILSLQTPGNWGNETVRIKRQGAQQINAKGLTANVFVGPGSDPSVFAVNFGSSQAEIYHNNAQVEAQGVDDGGWPNFGHVTVGVETKNQDYGFNGTIRDIVIFPHQPESGVHSRYDWFNQRAGYGPTGYHSDATLPQVHDYHVTLYNFLETITVSDVTLDAKTFSFDGANLTDDEVADLWLLTEGLTASSVTRAEPEWYVLDAGNGKGIEATGSVRIWHEPKGGGGYGGNPPRSWANEPAYLYQLDLTLDDGSQANPYYQDPALGRRALIVAIVDMMEYQVSDGNLTSWGDMYGKAMLSWAETYRWCKDLLTTEQQAAYEALFDWFVGRMLTQEDSPRAVNTNMDMFAIQAVADFYMATGDTTIQTRCLEAAKDWLLGFTDGELGVKHKVLEQGGSALNSGVFDPSGFIMEGGQPDIFYGGESIYHIAGAVAALMNRADGSVPSEWAWLKEVLRRLQEWRTYQHFYHPWANSPDTGGLNEGPFYDGGAGFSGRTAVGVPAGQADDPWKHALIGSAFANDAFVTERAKLESRGTMVNDIQNKLSYIENQLSSPYTGTPPEWRGWSPWAKKTPYLPPEGWYSSYQALVSTDDPTLEAPAARVGVTYNKSFGGHPVGDQYWAYKDTDANGRAFGWFMEAQAQQGGYGGWYGGKIETFWAEGIGIALKNNHGKTGCDPNDNEDSVCWNNIDEKAAHHVWGRSDDDRAFSTLLIRGKTLQRTSTFDLAGAPPSVTVNNVFNDPGALRIGQQAGAIEGTLEIENKVEAVADGARVMHTITSDGTDQVKELWASIPVYLRDHNPNLPGDELHRSLPDMRIEYYDGTAWQAMPEDTDSDGVPELVTSTTLRLSQDFGDASGRHYLYVAFPSSQQMRLSLAPYYNPYQGKTGVRTVHIDLHGNPGTAQPLPANKSVSYTIQTTDPTAEQSTSSRQDVTLQQGWNLVSTTVAPSDAAMETVFDGVASAVEVIEDEAGHEYRPADGVNEIGAWVAGEVYRVYATARATLSVEGASQVVSAVDLDQGWNWVPYTPSSAMPVEEAVTSIASDVIAVKGENGRVYYPAYGIDTIGEMRPGHGYKVYVRQSVKLDYP